VAAGQVDHARVGLLQVGHRYRLAGQQPWRVAPGPFERVVELGEARRSASPANLYSHITAVLIL
jgi:hypothetical protein